jgi:hypothetical protein
MLKKIVIATNFKCISPIFIHILKMAHAYVHMYTHRNINLSLYIYYVFSFLIGEKALANSQYTVFIP